MQLSYIFLNIFSSNRRIFTILLLLVVISALCKNSNIYSQEQGDLIIRNYSVKEYKADSQNWDIVQDNNGIMYFGNNQGVVQYDGTKWELIPLPTLSMVRTLAIDSRGRIYVGAVGEFGYLEPDSLGKMNYISLVHKMKEENRNFLDIWFLFCVGEDVWFNTIETIYQYRKGEFKTWKTQNSFLHLTEINKQIYTLDNVEGIKKVTEDSLVLIPSGNFFKNKPYRAIIPQGNNKMLVLTYNSGIFTYNFEAAESNNTTQIIKRFPTQVDSFLYKNRPYSCLQLKNGNIAIGTGGVIILNKKGELIRHIRKDTGLQGEGITSIFEDKENNLWMTTVNKGISKTDINSSISHWGEEDGMIGYANDIIRYNNKLYLSNFNGISYIENNRVMPIRGINTPCFGFCDFKIPSDTSQHLLLVTTNYNGVAQIENGQAKSVFSNITNIICIIQSSINPSILYLGRITGVTVVAYDKNNWKTLGNIENLHFQIRTIFEDKLGHIWLSNYGNQVVQIIPSSNILKPKQINKFTTGITASGYTEFNVLNNNIVFGNEYGIFRLNTRLNDFIPDTTFDNSFYNGSIGILNFREDKTGKIWISGFYGDRFGIAIPSQSKEYKWVQTPFNSIPPVQNPVSYFDQDTTIWLSGSEGLFRFKGNFTRQYPDYLAIIRQVIINNDSTIFFGNKSQLISNKDNNYTTIPYKLNSLIFKYSATSYYDESRTVYKTYLEGFDEKWSNWSTDKKKEYTNLHEGNYILHIKAKNIYDIISSEATYSFIIKPPFYRTIIAYITYAIVIGLLFWLIIFLNAKRLKAKNLALDNTVKKRTIDLHDANAQLEEQQSDLEMNQEELMSMNDKLVELDKFKEGMTSMIVHDLKNPLNTVLGLSKDPQITQAGKQMLNMVSNILDVQKFENTEVQLQTGNCTVEQCAKRALDEVRLLVERKSLILENQIPSNLFIVVDMEIITRVFVNTLTNAIKYTNNNGKIVLQAKEDNNSDFIKVMVSDTGKGIPKSELHKVFDKFSQLEARKSGFVQSTGLGLTFCKMAIEAHGGTIDLDSELGKGTNFWFTVPKGKPNDIKMNEANKPIDGSHVALTKELNLTKKDIVYLTPYLNELKKYSVFEYSDIIDIFNTIDNKDNERLLVWKQQIENAIRACNEQKYFELTNLTIDK